MFRKIISPIFGWAYYPFNTRYVFVTHGIFIS
jgi:hypothetical protein